MKPLIHHELNNASDLYFYAADAAYMLLPPESKTLINEYDRTYKNWSMLNYIKPVPQDVLTTYKAACDDPLANTILTVRLLGNRARSNEPPTEQSSMPTRSREMGY
jgi:hypothetical protein